MKLHTHINDQRWLNVMWAHVPIPLLIWPISFYSFGLWLSLMVLYTFSYCFSLWQHRRAVKWRRAVDRARWAALDTQLGLHPKELP